MADQTVFSMLSSL